MNRFKKLCALCAALFICASSFADDLANYQTPDWNDYEITFVDPDGSWTVDTYNYLKTSIPSQEKRSLNVVFNLDSEATLCFEHSRTHCLTVAVDGTEVQRLGWDETIYWNRRFVELPQGTHTVTISLVNGESSYSQLYEIRNLGVIKTNLVSVNLLEPGSLGTEVLHQVGRLQDVRNLKIVGRMNSVDWDKLKMMTDNLVCLDLEDAVITEIPEGLFSNKKFISSVKLPEGLTSIGNNAFNATNLKYINFPETLISIG